MKQFLQDVLKPRLSPEQWEWFEQAMHEASQANPEPAILARYRGASRHVGKRALALSDPEKARLLELQPLLPLDHWGADEAARAVLLLSAAHIPEEDYAGLIRKCYELGDSREQQSWLRSLSLLPGCERFLEPAIDACRSNILPLFEAIAAENPYPAEYFPELNFNQMVMKCLFNAVRLSRIAGLKSRMNPELSRMADYYASERRAAGRDVPIDIDMAIR